MISRARSSDDLPGCVAALRQVHEVDGYPTWWPPDPAAWLSPPGCTTAWVACEGDVVLGHLSLVRGVDEPAAAAALGVRTDQLAGVSRLFTTPAARGRGLDLGSRLLTTAQQWAREQDAHLVLDVVDDGAPAVALYDRLGWRVVDHRDADWTTPEGHRHRVRVYVPPVMT